MKKIRKAKINGKTYKFSWQVIPDDKIKRKGRVETYQILGLSDSPSEPPEDRFIIINTKQSARSLLLTILHEAAGHAAHWRWSEKRVKKFSNEIADLLWRIGYRTRK